MTTPTLLQLRRSYAKRWLWCFATPESLNEIMISMTNFPDDIPTADLAMIRELYRDLTGLDWTLPTPADSIIAHQAELIEKLLELSKDPRTLSPTVHNLLVEYQRSLGTSP